MPYKTVKDFCDKVGYEGFEALGFGLEMKYAPKPLRDAWAKLVKGYDALLPLVEEVEEILNAADVE